MSTTEEYQPINCDDYDSLELACQHHLVLQIVLRDGETLEGQASDLISRKHVEYLLVTSQGQHRELRLDHIARFSHPTLGTITISMP
ncbi:Rho-binding antiterminator [Edwardsiella piscicida]|uniref:Rho-specific inhibitor of transcription termination YaeO n=3 Tax=Edwardsiella TaxID=635 RepID=A0A0H3DQT2_EDWTF|nr:Rho-binding antiterminator [Edwardsiella piscicida]ACY83606.1 Rho-binding antiterminator [Edwardsiella tarda EIB202]ADM40826.1 Rho-specific inhibitor of transcription termination YaeO [Edwardsiella tarda FL6-60]AGH72868.1 Rho-specific inhibitor of transcription termination YaeO [Edwardsiella piscicida C07-087]AOP42239.1 Rho-binding antiterminator [Edwardsiella piscicida]ARD17610.1 Rho-binding antiterminator [Edwardsiella piscicida]